MVNVAVLGYGTVGSGVVEVIEKNKEIIDKRAGDEINIKYILDLRDFPGDPYEHKVVHDVEVILNDPDIQVICETMGGLNPAYPFSKRALEKGISVCTSNKELVAKHGPELIRLAREHNCNYLFEASVGGGIPIIRPLNSSLTAEKIDAITGILNGTTNYILTKMDEEGTAFEAALREAQEKGYAERNPEADIEGHDAGRKIAILSSLMSAKNIKYEDVYTEGISKITPEDFVYAHKMKKAIKLLAMVKEADDTYLAMVAPFLIGREHPLYNVNGVFNAVFVHGNMLGDSMYYGRGAGKLPTASAVVADVVDCARHIGKTVTCFWEDTDAAMADIGESEKQFFIRVSGNDIAAVQSVFGEGQVVDAGIAGEFGFVTPGMSEREFNEKAEAFPALIGRIRLENLE